MISTLDLSSQGPRCSRLAMGMMRLLDIYGGNFLSEELFGQALTKRPCLREQMQLVTKCDIGEAPEDRPAAVSYYNTSRDYIVSSLEHSLRSLRTDYVDLLLIHPGRRRQECRYLEKLRPFI